MDMGTLVPRAFFFFFYKKMSLFVAGLPTATSFHFLRCLGHLLTGTWEQSIEQTLCQCSEGRLAWEGTWAARRILNTLACCFVTVPSADSALKTRLRSALGSPKDLSPQNFMLSFPLVSQTRDTLEPPSLVPLGLCTACLQCSSWFVHGWRSFFQGSAFPGTHPPSHGHHRVFFLAFITICH